jgi:DNA-directed RNA polymerase specialized sigma24 family protein
VPWIRKSGCCSSIRWRASGWRWSQLPTHFREAIVLREIEGLSYKEIGAITRVAIGSVMSRLARARERLLAVLKLAATEPLL